ncbi:hypothetical protein SAMN04488104_100995 [Algoriphagus faecimaris]|uniref:Uncharacterized protein n=1 Tax=Algoriphagus faecimaris TaxID=686796 RepID=A0A1G6QK48_9BACT|nr:hypothetical protein [Algoriphagus faecimaris]SDC92344.1 hypothetical protein SAMN04488104_100995 [Algoriphagus faecimaris]
MNKKIFTLFLSLFILMFSCKEDEMIPDPTPTPDPDPVQQDPDPDPVVNIPTQVAKITLPGGVSYDLSGHSIWSNGLREPVTSNGDTKIPQITEGYNVAFVFDEEGNPILAGFVTKDESMISVESTAKVLLYYSTGAVLMAEEVSRIFVNQVHELPEFQDWAKQFEELWKADPKILSKPAEIRTAIAGTTTKILGESRPLDIRGEENEETPNGRVWSVTVDDGNIKSGLQIFSEAAGELKIRNRYRRRAHAFLYKSRFKPTGSQNYTEVLQSVSSGTAADADLAVGPTEGISNVFGSLIKQVIGDGMQMAVKEEGPMAVQLGENEDVAVYWLRIVGPGNQRNSIIRSDAEEKKLNRLSVETFALDFLIPLIGTATGGVKGQAVNQMEESRQGKAEAMITAVEVFLDAFPNIYDAVKEGDFKAATFASLEALGKEGAGIIAENLFKKIASLSTENISEKGLEEAGKYMGKILFVADGLLQTADWSRIIVNYGYSQRIEEWEVKAVASQVKLLPKEATITNASQQKLTASTVDIDESQKKDLRFKWSTEGKYGYLIETASNRGPSIETNDHEIFYNASTSSSNLSDDENLETIVVEAFLGDNLIGSDTMTVNVKKSLYEIKPDGITLTGKEEGDNPNKVKLHIEPAGDNGSPLGSNPDSDYKIVWTTPGSHGGLMEGESGQTLTTITTYGNGSIWYKATDDQTKESLENINARIYSKPKGATDDEYRLFEDLKATVKINNDEKKKIIHVNITSNYYSRTYVVGTSTRLNCAALEAILVPKEEDAVRYDVRFYDLSHPLPGTPKVYGWTPNGSNVYPFPEDPNQDFPARSFPLDQGEAYFLGLTFSAVDTNGDDPLGRCARLQGQLFTGKAEVIITLK